MRDSSRASSSPNALATCSALSVALPGVVQHAVRRVEDLAEELELAG
jgi:hypothetical protein